MLKGKGKERHQTEWERRIAERIAGSRWTLTAATIAIFVVAGATRADLALALGAAVIVWAVAAFAPRRTLGELRAEQATISARTPIDELTAIELAAAVPDPLVIFDRNGAVLHANEAAVSAFGPLNPATSLRLRFRTPEMLELIERVLRDRRAASIEHSERVPIERWYRAAAIPIGQAAELFVLVFKDQSEARRIDRMRSDFIANASHELRTPLASVAGFIETLRGPARDDAKARDQFLQIMQNQTARMARLIDDLLSLSRLEMKPYLKPTERVDLRVLVESVIDSLGHLAAELGVSILREMPEEDFKIRGDRDDLIQVFENLIENACKYGQSGGKVVVTIASNPEEVLVTIRDFGPGIAEEHIPRITERFYRVDVDTSRAQKGTGLGLSIVKHILTRHNARLSIESRLGDGAAFTVHFPAR